MYVLGDNGNSQLSPQVSDNVISSPRISDLNVSSLLSFSVSHNHSVWVNSEFKAFSSLNYQIDVKDKDGQPCKFASAACGDNYTLYLANCPNENDKYQLIYEQNYRNYHFLNIGDRNPIAIFGGYYNSAAIDSEGAILFPKHGDIDSLIKPVFLPNNDKAISIACCKFFYIALGSGGKAYIFNNINGNTKPEFTPINELKNKRFVNISGINEHCFLVSNDGKVYGYGNNNSRCLGVEVSSLNFGLIGSLSNYNIKAAFAGFNHSFFITSNGDSYACGYNDRSQISNNRNNNKQVVYPPELQSFKDGKATFYALGNGITVFFIGPQVPPRMPNKNVEHFINEAEINENNEAETNENDEEKTKVPPENFEEVKEKVVDEICDQPCITQQDIDDIPPEHQIITPQTFTDSIPKNVKYEDIIPTMKLHFDKPAKDINYQELQRILGDNVAILNLERGSTIITIALLSAQEIIGTEIKSKYENYAKEIQEKFESPLGKSVVGNFVEDVKVTIPDLNKSSINCLQSVELNDDQIKEIKKEVLQNIEKDKSKYKSNWEYIFSHEEEYDRMEKQVREDLKKNPYEMTICGETLFANKYNDELENIISQIPQDHLEDTFLYHGTPLVNHSKILDEHFKNPREDEMEKRIDKGYFGVGIYATNNLFYATLYANGYKILKANERAFVICCRAVYNKSKKKDLLDLSYNGKPIDQDIVDSYGINHALVGDSAKFSPITNDRIEECSIVADEFVFSHKYQFVPFCSFAVKRNENYVIWKDEKIHNTKENRLLLKELKRRTELNVYDSDSNEEALEIIRNKKFAKVKLITNAGENLKGKTLIEETSKIIKSNFVCLVYCGSFGHLEWISKMENVLCTTDPIDVLHFVELEMEQKAVLAFIDKLQKKVQVKAKNPNFQFRINEAELLKFPVRKDNNIQYTTRSPPERSACNLA